MDLNGQRILTLLKNVSINYDENSSVEYLLTFSIQLPFLPGKMKINKQDKFTCNLNDKETYVLHA